MVVVMVVMIVVFVLSLWWGGTKAAESKRHISAVNPVCLLYSAPSAVLSTV